jgi:hypothetical protein
MTGAPYPTDERHGILTESSERKPQALVLVSPDMPGLGVGLNGHGCRRDARTAVDQEG